MKKIIGGLAGLLFSASALASPIDFNVTAPENIQPNVPFSVSVTPNESTSELYDLKLSPEFENSRVTSDIYNEKDSKWQSTHYFLGESFPSQQDYQLEVTEEGLVGETLDLNAILRDSSGNKYSKSVPVNVVPEPFVFPALLAPSLYLLKKRKIRE